MVNTIDSTHEMHLESWVTSANGHPDFPVQNLPLGIFSPRRGAARAGVAIGDNILDLRVLYEMASPDARTTLESLAYADNLNGFLALGAAARRRLRQFLSSFLTDSTLRILKQKGAISLLLHESSECTLELPVRVGNYTDFFAGVHHAAYAARRWQIPGGMFPNYAHGPIAYHGRASSVRTSGIEIPRPLGQFRFGDDTTPIVLMGYYNPIYIYGVDKFLRDAKSAGVDGLIVVDLPPEEDSELCVPAMKAGLNFIRLATPTTDDKRLPAVLANTSGFVYYVSVTGITGSASADSSVVGEAVARIKRHTALPVCVGFGIRTSEAARAIAANADGAVVGSALVDALRGSLDSNGKATAKTVSAVAELATALSAGVRAAK